MEESWRFRPIQGNLCPTCSISHFPFCPPRHLPFPPDPFPDHRTFPLPETRYESFNPNPNFDRDSFRQFPPLPDPSLLLNSAFPPPPPPSRFEYTANEFTRGESVEFDRINKRMRIGEFGGHPPNVYNSNATTRMSVEDERRLSLIRDHGAPLHGPPMPVFEDEWKPRPPPSNSFFDPRIDSGDRMEMGSMSRYGPVFDSARNRGYEENKEVERREQDFGFRSDVSSMYFRNEDRSGRGSMLNEPSQQIQYGLDCTVSSVESYRSSNVAGRDSFYGEPLQQPQYGRDSLLSTVESYRTGNVATGGSNHVRECNDFVRGQEDNRFVNLGEREHPFMSSRKDDMNQLSYISCHAPNIIPEGSYGKYGGPDLHGLQGEGSKKAQEYQHYGLSNGMSAYGSDVPNYGNKQNVLSHGQNSNIRLSFEAEHPPLVNMKSSSVVVPQKFLEAGQFDLTKINQPRAYIPMSSDNGRVSPGQVQVPDSLAYSFHPPLPPLPPPPLPMEPPGPPPPYLQPRLSPPKTTSSIYTSPLACAAAMPLFHPPAFEAQRPKTPSPEKLEIIDASSLFKLPHRATRPDHIVIILRGLPGSGKSYLAKMLRDLEVESGSGAPRIHSMDDYFMTEVEKVEENESSRSSGLKKGKKRTIKKVMEYCYEPEMEEAYRSSMLKAFKKTVEEGIFTFIIVDDRNLRVADFAQFWAIAKRSSYEVYLLEAAYKDPVGCAARNVHGFTLDDIKKMAELWEEAPTLYLRLDIQSLSGDDLKEHGIQEVDMDMEDVACDEGPSRLHDVDSAKTVEPSSDDCATSGIVKNEGRWDAERDDPIGVRELGRSKWSQDVDEENTEISNGKRNSNALSGLIQAYSKGSKSVHWGDQVGKTGFSIGATKRAASLSLIIGPGAGYNLKSNPIPEEEDVDATNSGWESKKRNVFQEQLRAESESFRAVFDRRRQRIRGLDMEDE